MNEADASRAGKEAVLANLSEVLFVETLRTYIAHLPPEQTDWLAGTRDSEAGKERVKYPEVILLELAMKAESSFFHRTLIWPEEAEREHEYDAGLEWQ